MKTQGCLGQRQPACQARPGDSYPTALPGWSGHPLTCGRIWPLEGMVCIEQLPQKCSETFVRRQQIAGLLKPARSWQISALFLHKLSGQNTTPATCISGHEEGEGLEVDFVFFYCSRHRKASHSSIET